MRRSSYLIACLLIALSAAAKRSSPPSAVTRRGEFHISGTVVDAVTGTPLSNATVMISSTIGSREPLASLQTSVGGRFQFDRLAAAKYMLSAQARGYLTETLDEHEGFSTAVAVGPDLLSDEIRFPLHRDASLSGRVLDDANEPVGIAHVVLFRKFSSGEVRQTRTAQADDQGFYRFGHLQAGRYFVAVSAQPWYAQHPTPYMVRARTPDGSAEMVEPLPSTLDVAYPVTFYPDATEAESASEIALAAGQRATADVLLRAVPALHVRIHTLPVPTTSAEAGAVAGRAIQGSVRKNFFGADITLPASWIQTAPGTSEITGLAPGKYELDLTIADGKDRLQSRQTLDLVSNTEIDASDAAPLVHVSGKLRLEGDNPGNPIVVLLRDRKTRRTLNTLLRPTGDFEFPQGIAPGKYDVAVSGADIYLKSVSTTGARVTGREVVIGNEPVTLLLVVSRGVGTVTGTAYQDGKPRPGAMIILVPENPSIEAVLFRRDQSDSDGTFTLASAAPGKYVVVALADWDIQWQDPQVLRRYLPAGQPITVQPGGKYDVKVDVR